MSELRVKCSLCYGTGKGITDDQPCPRCLDGTQEIRAWHASRGVKIPKVKYLPTGYYHVSYSANQWAQFPANYKGVLRDDHIFQPAWNREIFTCFVIC